MGFDFVIQLQINPYISNILYTFYNLYIGTYNKFYFSYFVTNINDALLKMYQLLDNTIISF